MAKGDDDKREQCEPMGIAFRVRQDDSEAWLEALRAMVQLPPTLKEVGIDAAL